MTVITLIALLLLPAAATGQKTPDIVGEWTGALEVEGMRLRLVVHISKSDAGYSATLDSPDQGAKDIPITTVTFVNPDVKFGLPNLDAGYEGKLSGQTIEGTWTQGGRSLPLTLSRTIDKQLEAGAVLAAGTAFADR